MGAKRSESGRRTTSTPRSAASAAPAIASHAAAKSSRDAAPESRFQSRSPSEGASASDFELTELALVLLQALLEHEHQALGGIGIEHDAVAQRHAHFLLIGAPGLVRAEEKRHLFARAEHVAHVRVGGIHLRVVPDDLGLLRL